MLARVKAAKGIPMDKLSFEQADALLHSQFVLIESTSLDFASRTKTRFKVSEALRDVCLAVEVGHLM